MSDTLNGQVHSIGLASAFFNAEQLQEHSMSGEEHLLIVEVDRDDPGTLGMGVVLFAERIQIKVAEPA